MLAQKTPQFAGFAADSWTNLDSVGRLCGGPTRIRTQSQWTAATSTLLARCRPQHPRCCAQPDPQQVSQFMRRARVGWQQTKNCLRLVSVLAWAFRPPLSSEGHPFFRAMGTNELAGSRFSTQLFDYHARASLWIT